MRKVHCQLAAVQEEKENELHMDIWRASLILFMVSNVADCLLILRYPTGFFGLPAHLPGSSGRGSPAPHHHPGN